MFGGTGSNPSDYKLLDYMNGNIGVDVPITVTDYASFANAELRNLSNLAGIGGNALSIGSAVGAGAKNMTTQAIGGSVAGSMSALGDMTTAGVLGGIGAGVNMSKALYDLQTTNINNFNTTKGGTGALATGYLPQYVYLIFEYVKTEETPNLVQLAGRATNASGVLSQFSGYLEVDDVNLVCANATEGEKMQILRALNSGIII